MPGMDTPDVVQELTVEADRALSGRNRQP